MNDVFKAGVVAALVGFALGFGVAKSYAQTAQENIERTLGSLIVQNATCAAQGLGAAEELRKVKAELAEARVKLDAKPVDVPPPTPKPE